jgi:hypothetical protein
MLRKLTATHPGMDGDYGIFINAVSGTVAAFAGSGAR